MDKPVSVVIPVVAHHDRYLPDLFRTLSSDNEVLAKVIVARSELPTRNHSEYLEWLKSSAFEADLQCDITLSGIPTAARESPNRNRGWSLVESKFTAFLDADDLYARHRLTLLSGLASDFEACMVVHDYASNENDMDSVNTDAYEKIANYVVQPELIRLATFGTKEFPVPPHNVDLNISKGMRIPETYMRTGIHQAHSLVLTEIREVIQFRDIFPGADGHFCQEVLTSFDSVIFVPMRLSVWMNDRSAYARDRKWTSRVSRRIKRLRA
jgi:hypothetical protein